MYFTSITIENVKCFAEKQTMTLTNEDGALSPWTLILGDNGIGKTTLLKCLAWMQPVEEVDKKKKDDAGIKKIALKPIMDDFEEESTYERVVRIGNNVTANISATFSVDGTLGKVPNKNKLITHGMTIKTKGGKLDKLSALLCEVDTFSTINLFAYSASRHMGIRNFDKHKSTTAIDNLFSESADLFDASQVLSNLEYASLKEKGKGKATELFLKVKQMLADLLPDLKDADAINISSPLSTSGIQNQDLVTITTPYGEVPLYDLSLGYKTMLAWAVDLALRMLWSDPESKNPLLLPAVVIIDEIDLHLHPKWQRMVRDFLLKHFPNTQFICTAHSPFMAQAAETENLSVLSKHSNGDHVVIENNPVAIRGWRIGQIITSDLFDIKTERSPEIEGMIVRRRELLDKKKLTQVQREELNALNDKIAEVPVYDNASDQQMLDQIRQAASLLKEKGTHK